MLYRLLIALALLAAGAHTAAADEPALVSAKLHFDRGEKLYALAKFGDALVEYQKAYDAKPLPGLLFNIGQCYRNLGDYDSAIFSYRKYLQLEPEASNRVQIEQLISDLTAKRDEAAAVAPRTEPAGSSGDERGDRPIYKKWWFWPAIGVVAVAGGATIYGLTRSSGPPSTDLGNLVFGK